MNKWLQRLRDRLRRMKRRYQVRKIMEDIDIARHALQSAQIYLTERAIRLKNTKAKNPNDPLIPLLEGDIEEFERQIKRRQTRIEDLQRRLGELDPDGTIRASL